MTKEEKEGRKKKCEREKETKKENRKKCNIKNTMSALFVFFSHLFSARLEKESLGKGNRIKYRYGPGP